MVKKVNPIAKAMAYNRKRKQIVKPKKGKGSYGRQEDKKILEISKEETQQNTRE